MSGVLVSVVAGLVGGISATWALPKLKRLKLASPSAPKARPAAHAVAAAPGETAEPLDPSTALPPLIKALTAPAEDVADPRELMDMAQFQAVVAAMRSADVTLALLSQYALGANWPAACAALLVLSERPDRQTLCEALLAHLGKTRPFVLIYAFRYLNSLESRPPLGAAVLAAQDWWHHNPVIPGFFRDYFAQADELGDQADFADLLDKRSDFDRDAVTALLQAISHPFATDLLAIQKRWADTRIDRDFLKTVGLLWDANATDPLLVSPDGWREHLDAAETAINQASPRSVLVSGDPRVGKSMLIKLLAERLQRQGWTIFAAGGAELMAGQIYFGQLEGRIRQLVEALHVRRRLIWYVPDLAQLADSGKHQGQSATILDQILPAVLSGDLVLICESSQTVAARLFQTRPSLRSLIEVTTLQAMSEDETFDLAIEVAARIKKHAHLETPEATIAMAADLAQQYLGAGQLPGVVLELLKRAADRCAADGDAVITGDSVVATLSQISGLPATILDVRRRVDMALVRAFFAQRVMGQDKAISTLVDRVAMLKAGLIDPGKPIGVFLFAGPTGTGKTELAKTLAEFLFGSPDRMLRLDMSEFQTVDSTAKILGQRGEPGVESLIDRVRKQPFSVVLLDEFEKAHPNCWDLFLQIFDDGRLTDANGKTADFRHTIIILTSNLGAAASPGSGLGFGRQAGAFTADQVLRTISQTFRPEFINRLDEVIVFQPLSRDLMRNILHKELAQVLERRGLRDRAWAVEWEASAIEFLLDRGFSPEMGARPLKRAIDQLLLAPLAATMVEHRFPEGDQFLFVRSNGSQIEVEFVDPDAQPQDDDAIGPAPDEGLTLPSVILRQSGSNSERAFITAQWRELSDQLASDNWRTRTDDLRLALADPAIWSNDKRFQTFSNLELIGRIDEAARTAERLYARYAATSGTAAAPSRELANRLAMQLYNLGQGMEDVITGAPVDALLRIDPAMDAGAAASGETIEWCGRLGEMYRLWAAKRRMQWKVLGPDKDTKAPIVMVAGFGAFRTLSAEGGLHVLEDDSADGARRVVARICVAAGPEQTPADAKAYADAARRLAKISVSSIITRRYRENPAPLVRDIPGAWRSGRLADVLGGDFDLIGAEKRS